MFAPAGTAPYSLQDCTSSVNSSLKQQARQACSAHTLRHSKCCSLASYCCGCSSSIRCTSDNSSFSGRLGLLSQNSSCIYECASHRAGWCCCGAAAPGLRAGCALAAYPGKYLRTAWPGTEESVASRTGHPRPLHLARAAPPARRADLAHGAAHATQRGRPLEA